MIVSARVNGCVFELDPIRDPRWAAFVHTNPRGSIFHTVGWLKALGRSYGHGRVVYTNLVTRGRVAKWLGVFAAYNLGNGLPASSLPFDDCDLLVNSRADLVQTSE
jgi:hypothetical protein